MQPKLLAALVVGVYLVLGMGLTVLLHSNGHSLSYFSFGSGGDAFEYHQLGLSLLESHSFTLGAAPEYFRTPGYPLIIALLYGLTHSFLGIIALQILLVGISAYLIAKMGEQLGSPKSGLLAGALYALSPTVFIGALMTLSDVLFVTLLLALCYLCMKSGARLVRDACVLGVGIGFLTLVRPTGLFMLPLLAAWFVVVRWQSMRAALSQALLVVLLCVLTVSPWSIRNYQLTGQVAISSVAPYNFLFYNVAEYEFAHGGGTKDSVHERLVSAVDAGDTTDLRDLHMSPRLQDVAHQELKGRVGSYAFFHIVKTIPYYISSSIQAAKRAFSIQGVFPDLSVALPNMSGLVLQGHIGEAFAALLADPWVLLERLYWLGVLSLAIVSLFVASGRARTTLVFFALTALLFGALTGPVSFPRYRLPAEPFLLLSAAYAVSMGVLLWKKRRI